MEPSFIIFESVGFALFALTFYYVSKRDGKGAALAFLLPATLWGFILEFMTQEVFVRYHYGGSFLAYALNVPICIALFWATLMYWGSRLATGRLRLESPFRIGLAAAVPLILTDFFVLEPLAKTFGFWGWTPETLWFGASVGNFIGWFMVVLLYVSSYHFVAGRFKNVKKQLAYGLAFIAPNLAVLLVVLKVWTSFVDL